MEIFSNRENIDLQSNLDVKDSPSFLKKDFSSRTDPFIFTSIVPELLDWSNEKSWAFPAL